jgi:hypothetical protein
MTARVYQDIYHVATRLSTMTRRVKPAQAHPALPKAIETSPSRHPFVMELGYPAIGLENQSDGCRQPMQEVIMFRVAMFVLLGLSLVLLILVHSAVHAVHDDDDQMPDIEGL